MTNGVIAASTQIHFTADQLETLVKTFEGLRDVVCAHKLPLACQRRSQMIPNCGGSFVHRLELLASRLLRCAFSSYDPMNRLYASSPFNRRMLRGSSMVTRTVWQFPTSLPRLSGKLVKALYSLT